MQLRMEVSEMGDKSPKNKEKRKPKTDKKPSPVIASSVKEPVKKGK